MAERFKGRTAVVTGGVSGIGAGIAARLAAEGRARQPVGPGRGRPRQGRRSRTPSRSTSPTPRRCSAPPTDTAAALGRIDILVTSAGITGPNAPTWEYPVAAWDQVIDVNLKGVFYCNRAVVPLMLRNGYGRIVNIASIAGKEGNPNASAYSASKAGVIGLTKSLGKELATTEIRVNCVTPAAVQHAAVRRR